MDGCVVQMTVAASSPSQSLPWEPPEGLQKKEGNVMGEHCETGEQVSHQVRSTSSLHLKLPSMQRGYPWSLTCAAFP